MIDGNGLMGRRIRLAKLSTGLAKELTLWTGYDPLTTMQEVQDYLAAIRDAKAAIDRAHEALGKAFRRPNDHSQRETRAG